MTEFAEPYVVLHQVLSGEDIEELKDRCKFTLKTYDIPCFSLIDHRDSAVYRKITAAVEARLSVGMNYLNDFYIYTDSSFRTSWHMDTELFTFESAVNAWILLSPDSVSNPLGFIPEINDRDDRYFHNVNIAEGVCTFNNYRTRKTLTRSLDVIESGQIPTPEVSVGDILLINPKFFHKTNTTSAKHALAIKFVYGSRKGFLSGTQVRPLFWPEVKTFNDIVKKSDTWEQVVEGIRQALLSPDGKKKLSSGFYPQKFDLYKQMVQTI